MCAVWLKILKIHIKMAEFNSTEQTQILEKPFDHIKKKKKLSKRLTKDAEQGNQRRQKGKNLEKIKKQVTGKDLTQGITGESKNSSSTKLAKVIWQLSHCCDWQKNRNY